MKRFVSLLLTLVLVFSMLPVTTAANDLPNVTLSVDKSTVVKGENVTLSLVLDGNLNSGDVVGWQWNFVWDSTYFEAVSAEVGAAAQSMMPTVAALAVNPIINYSAPSTTYVSPYACATVTQGNSLVPHYLLEGTIASVTLKAKAGITEDINTKVFINFRNIQGSGGVALNVVNTDAQYEWGNDTLTAPATSVGYNISITVPHTHSGVKTGAQPATCTVPGNIDYWYCAGCQTYFSDENCTTAIAQTDTVLAAPGHAWTEQNTDPSYLVPGSGADCQNVKKYYLGCVNCDEMGAETWDSTVYGPHDMAPATCTAPSTCKVVGCNYTEGSTLEHDWNTTWSNNESSHWYQCKDCDAKKDEATHGGEASCGKQAQCPTCGKDYGSVGGHNYNQQVTTETYLASTATCRTPAKYYYSCTCGAKGTTTFEHGTVADHDYAPATCTVPKTCKFGCGTTEGGTLEHDWTEKVEDAAHLKTAGANCTVYNIYKYDCSRCDAISDTESFTSTTKTGDHIFTEQVEDDKHLVAGTGVNCQSKKQYYYDCAHCTAKSTEAKWTSDVAGDHVWSGWFQENDQHYKVCIVSACDEETTKENCSGGNAATCQTKSVCSTCEFSYGNVGDHAWGTDYVSVGAAGHAHMCQTSGCTEHDTTVPHVGMDDDKICDVVTCGYDANCKHGGTKTTHAAVASTCKTAGHALYVVCDLCSTVIEGSDAPLALDTNNHTGEGTKLGANKADPTCSTPGNTGDILCAGCDATLQAGTVIPAQHTLTKVPGTAATCSATGIADTWTCSGECGKTYIDEACTTEATAENKILAIDPEAHDWDEGVITVKPTTSTTGLKTYTCKLNAEHTKTEILPKEEEYYDRPNRPVLVVDKIEKLIDELPAPRKVTLADQDAIEAARKAYDALSKENKAKVTNYDDLVAAEEALAALLNAPVIEHPFVDVRGQWFEEAVTYVYQNGLMNGMSNNVFAPYENTSRGMIVTILWRQAGSPEPQGACPFQDVVPGAWYEKAITWAAENGIVNGYSATEFRPDANIERQQFTAILYRYAKDYVGVDVSVGEDTNILSYTDAFSVAEYAIPAMQWACGEGLINGIDGALQPVGVANRAQAATILMRFCENIQ